MPINEARLLDREGRLDEAEQRYLEIEQHGVLMEIGESLVAVSRIRRSRSNPKGAAEVIVRGLRLMSESGHRASALSGLEEGAAVLAALGKTSEAVEVLAWAEALRTQTGVVVPPQEVQALEELKVELGIAKGSLPSVVTTGVLPADLKHAVETFTRGLGVDDLGVSSSKGTASKVAKAKKSRGT